MLYLILWIILIGVVIFLLSKPAIEKQKSRLMNLYSSVLSDMNLDYRDSTIWAVNIVEISKSIINFSKEIDIINDTIKNEKPEDQKWLIDIIEEFTRELHLWIDRHESELEWIQENIATFQTEDSTAKSVLKLASKRLESHIELLKKV